MGSAELGSGEFGSGVGCQGSLGRGVGVPNRVIPLHRFPSSRPLFYFTRFTSDCLCVKLSSRQIASVKFVRVKPSASSCHVLSWLHLQTFAADPWQASSTTIIMKLVQNHNFTHTTRNVEQSKHIDQSFPKWASAPPWGRLQLSRGRLLPKRRLGGAGYQRGGWGALRISWAVTKPVPFQCLCCCYLEHSRIVLCFCYGKLAISLCLRLNHALVATPKIEQFKECIT